MKLLHKPFYEKSNFTLEVWSCLKNLSKKDITVHQADKGGKIVVMNKKDLSQLLNHTFKVKLFTRKLIKTLMTIKDNSMKE